MIIGTFNVENLFDRPKVMNQSTWSEGAPVLAAYAELSTLLENDPYSEADKARIVELLDYLGIARRDEGAYVQLRKIRGQLVRRPKDKAKPVTVVADGRSDWIGWVELKTEHVSALAMEHTAMVIRDLGADVLGVVEAESRPLLEVFTDAMLKKVGGDPYEQVMLIDGNDSRGIDVGLLSRFPISVAVAIVFPARSGGGGCGEAAEEVAAVGGPYEAFGDDGVAFIVDLEAAAIHEPGPGPLDDPASG